MKSFSLLETNRIAVEKEEDEAFEAQEEEAEGQISPLDDDRVSRRASSSRQVAVYFGDSASWLRTLAR